jgi:cell division protein FtsQ
MRDLHHKKIRPQRNKNRQKRERKPRKPIQYRRIVRKSARVCVGLILVTLLWTVGTEVYELVTRTTLFTLEKIEVSRLKRISRDDIVAQAGVKHGDPMLSLDLKHIVEKLQKNAWIDTLKVRRRFPGTLTFEISEREPVAVANMGYLYYLDAKGGIFKPLTDGDRLDFPIVTGIVEEDLVKDPEGTRAMIRTALGILDLLKKGTVFRLEDISEIHLDKGYGYTLFTAHGGVPVKLGNSDFAEKLARLSRIYKELAAQSATVEYIDVNYSDKIVVKKV